MGITNIQPELMKQTFWVLNWQTFNQIIREQYGKPEYDVVLDNEWTNDSEHIVYAHPDDLDEYEEIDLEVFRKGSGNRCGCSPSTLLSDLARRKVAPDGGYLITVMW